MINVVLMRIARYHTRVNVMRTVTEMNRYEICVAKIRMRVGERQMLGILV